MSNGSIIVLVAVGALMALAVWRNIKKGAPCACGGSRTACGCGYCGGCAESKGNAS